MSPGTSRVASIVPLQRAHLTEWFGVAPSWTIRGYAAVADNGKVLGVAGVRFTGQVHVAFSEWGVELRRNKRACARACRMLQAMFDTLSHPVYAVADANEPRAQRLLVTLGFKPTGIFGDAGETMVRG